MRFPRSSGILLHPTSLPGKFGCGDLGDVSIHFIEWMLVAGQKVWQVLPLEPTGYGNSPYMSHSAFAGNPLLIGFEELLSRGWISASDLEPMPQFPQQRIDFSAVIPYRLERLRRASGRFFSQRNTPELAEFEAFCKAQRAWLEDYSLFEALNNTFHGSEWTEWDRDLAARRPQALKRIQSSQADEIRFWKFTQWLFYRQWARVKKYANDRGISIFGDIPIFVSHHSADVWSHPDLFFLDKSGRPTFVAGVPPDYFSETGQRWGNPLYRWSEMAKNNYRWWIERFRRTFTLVDIARIDHFRGFAGYWQIPASEETAVHGRWVKGPGAKLFNAVQKQLGTLAIVAEDLGVITPDVVALREKFGFPGMKVLQFAFAEGPENYFLPHGYEHNCVVYTGTHDNDTTRGWFVSASEREKAFVRKYCGSSGEEAHQDLIRLASRSIADLSVFPFQDVLGLGTEGRMNFPGTVQDNWEWRFSWDQVKPEHALRMYEMAALYGRANADRLQLPAYAPRRENE